MVIGDLIDQSIAKTDAIDADLDQEANVAETPEWARSVRSPAELAADMIPTLAPGVYQPTTPMLRDRFAKFGRWLRATHGHWLSLSDMAALWGEPDEPLLRDIAAMREGGEKGWPNEASALFRPERLSLFAGSDLSNEKIYLLWLEFEDEPELWVYDSNGEARYRDLASYLQAYLTDDLSAFDRSWRAQSSDLPYRWPTDAPPDLHTPSS